MPLISVIIPVYNVEKYLARCLDSVLGQTFKDFEFICINDGSTDNSEKILKEYAKKDIRINIITQTNQGQSVARNNGLKQANGKYIYFLDSDDFIHPQLLEITYYFIVKYQADWVCFDYFSDYFKNKRKDIPKIEFYSVQNIEFEIMNNPLKYVETGKAKFKIPISPWSKLYKKKLLRGISFIPGVYYEDNAFLFEIIKKRPKTVIIDASLYYYANNETSTMKSFDEKRINDYHKNISVIFELYKDSPDELKWISKNIFWARYKTQYKEILNTSDKAAQKNLFNVFAKQLADMDGKCVLRLRSFSVGDIKWFLRFKYLALNAGSASVSLGGRQIYRNKFTEKLQYLFRYKIIISARIYKKVFLDFLNENDLEPSKTVFIIQTSFFDYIGDKFFSGGAERYCLDLSNLINRAGLNAVLLQYSSNGIWAVKKNNLTVIGLPSRRIKDFFYLVNFLLPDKIALAIYSWIADNIPVFAKKSMLLCHGIFWDGASSAAKEKRQLEKKYEMFNKISGMVSVDLNTISWLRSTFPSLGYSKKMTYIPNYADTNHFYPRPGKKEAAKTRILFPRRICYNRGYFLFSAAGRRILEEFPDTELAFIGYTYGEVFIKDIELLKRDFPARIIHDIIDADKMPEVYRNADIVVIPTIYSEGTSLSCLEAMASGLPVISTNIGGLGNLILNNYNGLLINPCEEELYNAMRLLLSNKNFADMLAENALSVVRQAFNKEKWEKEWNLILAEKIKS
ncbi:MAG: glycosyltransferase [Elusimicrobiota bacterium]|nr:glycosyltransferase [Elusimicrobiota bacterium]